MTDRRWGQAIKELQTIEVTERRKALDMENARLKWLLAEKELAIEAAGPSSGGRSFKASEVVAVLGDLIAQCRHCSRLGSGANQNCTNRRCGCCTRSDCWQLAPDTYPYSRLERASGDCLLNVQVSLINQQKASSRRLVFPLAQLVAGLERDIR
jgi:hypothetical protein